LTGGQRIKRCHVRSSWWLYVLQLTQAEGKSHLTCS
jgi:hypothetical protein